MKSGIIGAGSWGSAMAIHIGGMGIPVVLWIREKDVFEDTRDTGQNRTFLPEFSFPPSVTFTNTLEEAVTGNDVLFLAVPSKFCRKVLEDTAPFITSRQVIISLTKGIEADTLQRMSEVVKDVCAPDRRPRIAVLSGPSFAKEVAQGHPTAVVIASEDIQLAREMQHFVSNPVFRCYTSSDVLGVELSGAMKNVIAIASGISDGLEYGNNTRAALITRGIAEMSRLGEHMGANRETFAGLAGIGDLVLTCTGQLSRNRSVGMALGQGQSLESVTQNTKMVAEGVTTTLSVKELTSNLKVDTPICHQVYRVLYDNKDANKALQDLMTRPLKHEFSE